MKIEFTGRGTDVTDALKSYTTDKLEKLSRFVDNILDVTVIFTVEKHRHTAEINIKAGQDRMVAKETTNDMYNSISGSLEKIEKQAKKLKNKVSSKKRKPQIDSITHDEVLMESEVTRVVPISVTNFKPMTIDESLMELEQGNEKFIIFRDSENGLKLSILFERENNTYGIVQLNS